MKDMRINKYIAKAGFASRRKADQLIENGRVTLNGAPATLGDTVSEGDVVAVDGQKISTEGKEDIYIAFHKPVGVISTLDPEADNSVLDYIDIGEHIFYVGRLDVNSEGLMLFTNNGDVAQKITDSEANHEKAYEVTVDKKVTRKFLTSLRQGVMIDRRKTKPARIKQLSDTKFRIILTEGRNRQIRKMCKAFGYEVKKLKRIRIMNIKLRDLGAGNWRELTKKERRGLLEALN